MHRYHKLLFAAVCCLVTVSLSSIVLANDEPMFANPTQASKAERLAEMAEVPTTVEDIADMRDAGMGWGDIAHSLGVHPSRLGEGFLKDDPNIKERTIGITGVGKSKSKGGRGGKGGKGGRGGKGGKGGRGGKDGKGGGKGGGKK